MLCFDIILSKLETFFKKPDIKTTTAEIVIENTSDICENL
tara:strand:- start:324 stop:443 length:120 start_codon:yes stop_codon:yes gene_type:complete